MGNAGDADQMRRLATVEQVSKSCTTLERASAYFAAEAVPVASGAMNMDLKHLTRWISWPHQEEISPLDELSHPLAT